jgi:3alpha(or 20beta)-hydroxysteroid dehydrogenase
MFSLENKICVITGGSSGIGEASARRFGQAGAKVVIASRRDAGALAKEIGGIWLRTDVSVESQVKACMDETAATFGRIDVLINNAGYSGPTQNIRDTDVAEYLENVTVNMFGPFFGIKHALPHMRRGGSIITTTSLSSVIGMPGYGAYTASKFAATGMLKCAAVELGPLGIRVNEICPTTVDTPMLWEFDSAEAEIAMTRTASPLGRIVRPQEIAALMHFLAADDCGAISGHKFVVDGGQTAGASIASLQAMVASDEDR